MSRNNFGKEVGINEKVKHLKVIHSLLSRETIGNVLVYT